MRAHTRTAHAHAHILPILDYSKDEDAGLMRNANADSVKAGHYPFPSDGALYQMKTVYIHI